MATWGIPYQGTKSRLAPWIIDHLPAGPVLVDVFAGGCAVTHCALVSGKWDRVVANDVGDAPRVFADAARGEYDGWAPALTRGEFNASTDTAERLCFSYANGGATYAYGAHWEAAKTAAGRMICAPSIHERRAAYRTFLRELQTFIEAEGAGALARGSSSGLQGLEALQAVDRVQGLAALGDTGALDRLQVTRGDYRTLAIPAGAVLYADPPYRGTTDKRDYNGAGARGSFDAGEFDSWLDALPCPCVVSEREAPAGCVCVAEVDHIQGIQGGGRAVTERLYVQSRFESDYRAAVAEAAEVEQMTLDA